MIIKSKEKTYHRIELEVSYDISLSDRKEWDKFLVKYLEYFIPENKKLCLMTLDTRNTSIIHEFGQPVKKLGGIVKKYQYVTIDKLSKNDLSLLIEESEFYLGYLIIGIIEVGLEDDFINKMTELEFGKIDISNYYFEEECIFMEADGKSLYWTNPNFSLDESRRFMNTLIDIK